MKKIAISGTGCTLLDFVFYNVDFSNHAFNKYSSRTPGDGGLTPGQLVFADDLEKYSSTPLEKILFEITGNRAPDSVNLGGPAVVSMIHAAQLLQGRAEIFFVAAVGNDQIEKQLRGILHKTPLKDAILIEKDRPTPYTHVLSDPGFDNGHGERTFINNIGAAGNLSMEDLPPAFLDADILVLGGTALVPLIHDSLDEILEQASSRSFTIVNTVFDFRNERKNPGKPWPLGSSHKSFKYIDLLIMDREEALKISGKNTIKAAIDYFMMSPVKAFMITDGPRPVFVYAADPKTKAKELRKLDVSDMIVRELKDVKNGDTTGAGDNFTGGVIYSIADQLANGSGSPDLFEAAKWGIVSGGFACSYLGGTFVENEAGEKLRKLNFYYINYKQQLKLF